MSTMHAATSVKLPISGLNAGAAADKTADSGAAAVANGVSGAANSAPDGMADAAVSAAQGAQGGAPEAINGAMSTLGQADSLFTWGSYFQSLALLFLIIAILFAALWFLKRRGGIKMLTFQGDLSLESRMALGPKKSLVVVRFLNKRVLLGVTDQQITLLTELPTDEDATAHPDSDPSGAADFAAHLAEARPSAPKHSG